MGMPEVIEHREIDEVKGENEKIIMEIFGVKYEEFFPQVHQCEK